MFCTTPFCFKCKRRQPQPAGSAALTGSHTRATNTPLSVHLLKEDVKVYFGGAGGRIGEGHLPCPIVSTFWTAFSTSRYTSTVWIETLKFKCRKGTIHVYKCHALHLKTNLNVCMFVCVEITYLALWRMAIAACCIPYNHFGWYFIGKRQTEVGFILLCNWCAAGKTELLHLVGLTCCASMKLHFPIWRCFEFFFLKKDFFCG